jgi:hypothetical protein
MSLPLRLALVETHAELAGEIRQLEDRLEQLRSDVLHVEAVIRLMDPAFQPEAIVPKKRDQGRNWFGNGELCGACWRRCGRRQSP